MPKQVKRQSQEVLFQLADVALVLDQPLLELGPPLNRKLFCLLVLSVKLTQLSRKILDHQILG